MRIEATVNWDCLQTLKVTQLILTLLKYSQQIHLWNHTFRAAKIVFPFSYVYYIGLTFFVPPVKMQVRLANPKKE